jgi:ABC-type microcin C transport system permease subunit YejB
LCIKGAGHADDGPQAHAGGGAQPHRRDHRHVPVDAALPGDPAAYFAGPAATNEAIEQIRVQLGLDKPLYVQFVRYVGDLARGDLGNSLTTGSRWATRSKRGFRPRPSSPCSG